MGKVSWIWLLVGALLGWIVIPKATVMLKKG